VTAEVSDLAAHRALLVVRRQLAAVAAEHAALRLRLQPETASRVLLAQVAAGRDAAPSRLARAREPLLELMALLLAEQQVQGDAPDPLRALAVALQEPAFVTDMPQLVAACLDTLPAAYDQLRREYGPGVFDSD